MKLLRWPRPGSARRATSFTFRSLAERSRAIPIVVVLAAGAAFGPPLRANPVPDDVWAEWLRLPGRYLRTPSDTTRRRLVRLLGDGEMPVFLVTPDTLALMLRNIETFVPLFVEAQSPPFMPDARTQAWFRSVAPEHRAEMIAALGGWLAPGLDSLAPYHDQYFSRRITRGDCSLMYPRSGAAERLADWDARETLPAMKEMRRQWSIECASSVRDTSMLFGMLDDAIRRLEGGTSLAPLTPDGHGGVRSRLRSADLLSVQVPGGAEPDRFLGPSERTSLWNSVLAAREAPFVAGDMGSVFLQFQGEKLIRLRITYDWGLAEFEQYPHPEVYVRDERLYLQLLELTGARPPGAAVSAIGSRARFRREHVEVTIDRGEVRVEGEYEFRTDGSGRPFAVKFPPVRSQGDVPLMYWAAHVEWPRHGGSVAPRNLGLRDSCFVVFPATNERNLRVRATSADRLRDRQRVVYLLRTARAWGEPLERADLEVDWPDSLGSPRFSLPMKRTAHSARRSRYRFHAAPFKPDTDLVVTWGH